MSALATVGTIITTMLAGHVVDAEIIGEQDKDGYYKVRFLSHHDSGETRLCLDFGAGWNVAAGYEFAASDANIERATYWIETKKNNYR
jgi:hypothetical protein